MVRNRGLPALETPCSRSTDPLCQGVGASPAYDASWRRLSKWRNSASNQRLAANSAPMLTRVKAEAAAPTIDAVVWDDPVVRRDERVARHRLAQHRPHRVPRRHAFSAADKLNPQTVQFVHYLQKVPSAPRNAVESRDQHDGELLPSRIRHEGVETRTACSLATNTSIFVFVDNLESSLCRQLSKIVQLRFDVLVGSRNADVQGCSLHLLSSSLWEIKFCLRRIGSNAPSECQRAQWETGESLEIPLGIKTLSLRARRAP